ncbi:MAG: CDP-diacylglycerol diphosphatase [Proteobacteria bacterium]|nr:CDP-diacylglycerol diphosphatase [Pseudomonadota bacterium]
MLKEGPGGGCAAVWPAARRAAFLLGLPALLALAGVDPARDRLRAIVQGQCVPHWLATRSPAPCARVGGEDPAPSYAVLHDRKGGAHFLLIPTRTLLGMESPEARDGQAVNYFAAA